MRLAGTDSPVENPVIHSIYITASGLAARQGAVVHREVAFVKCFCNSLGQCPCRLSCRTL